MNTLLRGSGIRLAGGLLLAAGVLALAGSWNPFSPAILGRSVSSSPPVPHSASNALLLLKWAYENRSFSEYRELFLSQRVRRNMMRDSSLTERLRSGC